MPFIVEDGTGLAGANSYASVQEFRDYWADRGTDVSALTDTQVEQLLVRGSISLDGRYGKSWRGSRSSYTQGLEWPRTEAFYDDGSAITGVPRQVQHGAIEFAYRENSAPTTPDRVFDEGGRAIKKKTQKVDVISTSVEYAGAGDVVAQDQYPQVTNILRPVLASSCSVGAGVAVYGTSQSDNDSIYSDSDAYKPSFDRGFMDNDGCCSSAFGGDKDC